MGGNATSVDKMHEVNGNDCAWCYGCGGSFPYFVLSVHRPNGMTDYGSSCGSNLQSDTLPYLCCQSPSMGFTLSQALQKQQVNQTQSYLQGKTIDLEAKTHELQKRVASVERSVREPAGNATSAEKKMHEGNGNDCAWCYGCGGSYPYLVLSVHMPEATTDYGSSCGSNLQSDTYPYLCCQSPSMGLTVSPAMQKQEKNQTQSYLQGKTIDLELNAERRVRAPVGNATSVEKKMREADGNDCAWCYGCGGSYPYLVFSVHTPEAMTDYGSSCGSDLQSDTYPYLCCQQPSMGLAPSLALQRESQKDSYAASIVERRARKPAGNATSVDKMHEVNGNDCAWCYGCGGSFPYFVLSVHRP